MRIPCLFVLSILLAACQEAQPAAPVGIQGRVSLARAASCESSRAFGAQLTSLVFVFHSRGSALIASACLPITRGPLT